MKSLRGLRGPRFRWSHGREYDTCIEELECRPSLEHLLYKAQPKRDRCLFDGATLHGLSELERVANVLSFGSICSIRLARTDDGTSAEDETKLLFLPDVFARKEDCSYAGMEIACSELRPGTRIRRAACCVGQRLHRRSPEQCIDHHTELDENVQFLVSELR